MENMNNKKYIEIYNEATKQVIIEDKIEQYLTEDNVLKFIQSNEYRLLMNEIATSTNTGGDVVDDGPGFLYGNFKSYSKVGDYIAQKCGYTVINYIMQDPGKSSFGLDTSYPKGPGEYPVSWYPSGDTNKQPSSSDINRWKKHLDSVIKSTGYQFIDSIIGDIELR